MDFLDRKDQVAFAKKSRKRTFRDFHDYKDFSRETWYSLDQYTPPGGGYYWVSQLELGNFPIPLVQMMWWEHERLLWRASDRMENYGERLSGSFLGSTSLPFVTFQLSSML